MTGDIQRYDAQRVMMNPCVILFAFYGTRLAGII
jgi:hypothetical protein